MQELCKDCRCPGYIHIFQALVFKRLVPSFRTISDIGAINVVLDKKDLKICSSIDRDCIRRNK